MSNVVTLLSESQWQGVQLKGLFESRAMPHAERIAVTGPDIAVSARAEASRLASTIGRDSLAGVTLVATVPAQHMYGFESSVLIALLGGAAFDAGRPFYPADVVAALASTPAPCMLVTTPFHLKALLDSAYSPSESDPVESIAEDPVLADGSYDAWVKGGSKHPGIQK